MKLARGATASKNDESHSAGTRALLHTMVKLKRFQWSKQHSVLILCFFLSVLAMQGSFFPQWHLTTLSVREKGGDGSESFSDSHVKKLEQKVTDLEETVTKLQRR